MHLAIEDRIAALNEAIEKLNSSMADQAREPLLFSDRDCECGNSNWGNVKRILSSKGGARHLTCS